LPSSGTTGRLKTPTTKLPPLQAGKTGKVVVMLSSVAKATNSQKLLPPPAIPGPGPAPSAPPTPSAPPKIAPPLAPTGSGSVRPPPLPPQKVMPQAAPLPAEQRLSSTTFVKLPPKTSAPAFVSLVPKPTIVPSDKKDAKVAPPLLPAKRSDPVKPSEPPKPDVKKSGPIILNAPASAPPGPARGEMKKTGLIKLNPPAAGPAKAGESIFAEIPEPAAPPVPEGWKRLETGELPLPPGGLKATDPFAQSRRLDPKPAPVAPVPVPKPAGATDSQRPSSGPLPSAEPQPSAGQTPSAGQPPSAGPPLAVEPPMTSAKDKPRVAPPPLPSPAAAAKTEPALNPAPVTLLPSGGAPAHPVNVAPPLVGRGHEETPLKLAPPHLAEPVQAPETVPPLAARAIAAPAPENAQPPPLPPAPARDETKSKVEAKEKLSKSAPIVLTNAAKFIPPAPGDVRPALRPAVLPTRATRSLPRPEELAPVADKTAATSPDKPVEVTARAKPQTPPESAPEPKIETSSKEPEAKAIAVPDNKPVTETESASGASKAAELGGAAAAAVATGAVIASAGAGKGEGTSIKPPPKMPALPPTRAERARKRRLRGVVAFWILVPFVAAGLFWGILYFGRDTRVEGQVIPPPGMTLSDEVWIVSDFSSLAAGVADDVAKERVPLQLAIQEAQDHVQRVQADIASREERIHLIQDDIQGAKDQAGNLVKKSQADAQAIYDSQGKELDDEYNSKLAGLKQAIADRAASLKLQYQPDPAFPSPEVWANAYRLALYQVPAGVDGVKEHQWIADQLKGWRDFEKSMDDRYDQMREQAAQLKVANGPKIADLNAKIEDLQQRITGTQAEEAPLKAELTQAQSDLAAAQDAESGLDEKYYGQLDALPAENISYHISVQSNGRFTWVPDNPFGEGEVEHNYIIFARATRADGRQYWSMHTFTMRKNETTELTLEPGSFESTKQILRPNLSPDEIEQ
jgi:hypothetical protein